MKPPLGGLLNRHGIPDRLPHEHLGGFVLPVDWAALQPSLGAPVDSRPFDAADDWITKNAPGMGYKVRPYLGAYAPDEAKALDGGPFTYRWHVPPHSDGHKPTVGRFWAAPGTPYAKAANDFVRALGAMLDHRPTCRGFDVSATGQESAEVCLLFGSPPPGYSEADRQAALLHSVDVACAAFPTTHVSIALHALATWESRSGGAATMAGSGWKATVDELQPALWRRHGTQLSVFHTGLGDKTVRADGKAPTLDAYAAWFDRKLLFGVQTESLHNGVSHPQQQLGWFAGSGGIYIELPSGWDAWAKEPWFGPLNDRLIANARGRS